MGTIPNRYKVPGKMWRRWGKEARYVFNETYSTLVKNQKAFLHPRAVEQIPEYWDTTAWNVAWYTACAAEGVKNRLVEASK